MIQNQRPRRLRQSAGIRKINQETILTLDHLVYPIFIKEGGKAQKIASMPGQNRWPLNEALEFLGQLYDKGLRNWALFPVIENSMKTSSCEEAWNPKGLACVAIEKIKQKFPESVLICDVALDPYNADGHDGLVKDGKILNDETLVALGKQALSLAKAGADVLAPSDMMDGRVGFLRGILEESGFKDTLILSYCAKYASQLYGPFREALDSAPRAGDKKTYQMDPANVKEALKELTLDLSEGADLVMVKPAGFYLDVISEFARVANIPVAAYQVSGEYSMICFGAEAGLFDREKTMIESLISIRRAGASLIFTYFAAELALADRL